MNNDRLKLYAISSIVITLSGLALIAESRLVGLRIIGGLLAAEGGVNIGIALEKFKQNRK